MLIKMTKMALAGALVVGATSAALAGDNSGEYSGGFVTPGSMDGVNPVHHPELFSANAGKVYDRALSRKLTPRAWQKGREAYDFVPAAKQKLPPPQTTITDRDRGEDYGAQANK
jgi:hypothetical protein